MKDADKFLARVRRTKTRNNVHINMCPKIFNLS
jgi:hypothetical protein